MVLATVAASSLFWFKWITQHSEQVKHEDAWQDPKMTRDLSSRTANRAKSDDEEEANGKLEKGQKQE